jgi:hypothetical protein
MRWANLLFCCLFLVFAFAEAPVPLLAADFGSPQVNRDQGEDDGGGIDIGGSEDDAQSSDKELKAREVAEFCYEQRNICRKLCDLHSNFDDRFDGCSHSCDSRQGRCTRTSCYRWSGSEYVIAQRFGGNKCAL